MNKIKNELPGLLIADDDESLCQQLSWSLSDDFSVCTASHPEQIKQMYAKESPELVLLDLNYSDTTIDGSEGLGLIDTILGQNRPVKIIVMTGNQEVNVARQALNAGAHDHLLKPLDADEVNIVLKRAYFAMEVQKDSLQERPEAAKTTGKDSSNIMGVSGEIRSVLKVARKISVTDAAVLISGESGTGKELLAHYIHKNSDRIGNTFVPINCGAIPEHLLESELFGHEKGAFTGASVLQKGKFESANRGTIFLDEIGDLPQVLQVKLLRFLQDQVIYRVGATRGIKVNVRIIAATNKNLDQEVENGRFREDLFYRLNVINLEMPPLRDRGADIELLASYFLNKFVREYGKAIRDIAPKARKAMRMHKWPGNVRELENRMRKATILARHSVIVPSDLGLDEVSEKGRFTLRDSVSALERSILKSAMRRHSGVISHVASELAINRTTLYDLLKKHNVNPKKYKLN